MIMNFTGVSGSRVAYLASQEIEQYDASLIIVSSAQVAERLKEDISFFVPEIPVFTLPEEESLRFLYEARDKDALVRRIRGMEALTRQDHSVVIAPITALLRPVSDKDRFLSRQRIIRMGDEVDPGELKTFLVSAGYEFSSVTSAPGEFSGRGDILDVFSPSLDNPVRLEFFDTELDSIRTFDPLTQRSLETISEIRIVPAVEFMPTEPEIQAALTRIQTEFQQKIDELKTNQEENNLQDHRAERYEEEKNRITDMFLARTNLPIYADYLSYFDVTETTLWHYMAQGLVFVCDPTRIAEEIPEYLDREVLHRVYSECSDIRITTPFPERIDGLEKLDEVRNLHTIPVAPYNGQLQMLASSLRGYRKKGYQVHLISSSEERSARLREYLDEDQSLGGIHYEIGNLTAGLILEDTKECYITESDIFPGQKKKALKRRKKNAASIDFSDLRKGDYVVHEIHGIGRFEGIRTLETDGEKKDYLKIHYSGSDVLYIPTEQLDIIQRYIGNEGNAPKLSRLSGGEWRRTRERVRKSVMAIAEDLVKLYAEREAAGGYAFPEDSIWQKEFEDDFPYTETDDQIRAVEEIKADMESPLPMDRLLCGDVGYGKTEVAARAIFKCISEGKQAVLLAPTTLLVDQHYHNLKERFAKFPFEIEMLSRFRSEQEQNRIIDRLKKGTVDLIIGTHRVLSDDVKYKDLGLLVIDEEQRFGVKHKEKIKMLRKNVDVLTLSATPIPRTLNMSLTGIKNISTIEEPPQDRLPVQTYVTPEDEELIREVIERELNRNGQVFVIFNRVKGIRKVAETVQELVPQARIGIGHGRLDEKSLENVMLDFVEGRTNVLVSTTIIENGIDIPNANTIIILDADRMGLSQLYQLRGRVGRSNTLAYAYLTYKPEKVLTDVARKRLAAIREFTEFGAGFKLAMRDLELRGAGNVLGEAQHGHIEGIGYELYCKEIERAVKRLKGESVTESRSESTLEFNVPARIPNQYIGDETLKLQAYKKIAQITDESDADDVMEELIDRYGDIPEVTLNLIRVAEIRSSAERLGIEILKQTGNRVQFTFYEENHLTAYGLVMATQAAAGRLTIQSGTLPSLSLYVGSDDILKQVLIVLRALLKTEPAPAETSDPA